MKQAAGLSVDICTWIDKNTLGLVEVFYAQVPRGIKVSTRAEGQAQEQSQSCCDRPARVLSSPRVAPRSSVPAPGGKWHPGWGMEPL